jgi:hypothetical protein
MHLFAITGLRQDMKRALALTLIERISGRGKTLTLLDNSDEPEQWEAVSRQRLVGGCVCCSLAAAMIPIVWRLPTDCSILITSVSADPETLARLLDSFTGTHIHAVTFALVDERTRETIPYLAQKLAFYARYTLYEPFCLEESVDAALRLSL